MSSPQGTTTSTSRAAEVLLAFMDGDDRLGISDIARRLGLSKAVVHRIVTSYVEKRILIANRDRSYSLGPAMAALGARALRSSTLRIVAIPLLGELQQRTGETATVSALINRHRVYLAQVEGKSEIKMSVEIGRRHPLHVGSSGRCLLAFQTPTDLSTILEDGLEAFADGSVTDRAVLMAQLDQIRRDGWTSSLGERQQGAGSVAAPVFNLDGRAIGAVSVCGPVDRMTQRAIDSHAGAVVDIADRISRGLGWRGGLPERPYSAHWRAVHARVHPDTPPDLATLAAIPDVGATDIVSPSSD